jgi:trehalose-6-phosphate synthase
MKRSCYADQSIPFDRMSAMYRVADAMVITSVRDGMNLVAYEYIACQQEQPGALILSEFAGAAHSLADAPIVVNPWNISELSDAMYQAITMAPAELRRRQESMYKYVTTQTAQRWARDYIRNLLVATNTSLEWLGKSLQSVPRSTHLRDAD